MKTYRVYMKQTLKWYVDVEAKDEDEAYEKAEDVEFDEFKPVEEYNDWQEEYGREFYDCEEEAW